MQMRLTTIRIAAIVFTVLVVLCGRSEHAAASTQPTDVSVQIMLLDVRDFDLVRGTCAMDYYMVLQCRQAPCEPKDFELTNGQIDNLDLQNDDPLRKVYRIQATLKQKTDLFDFPFDSHELRLEMEDKNQTTAELVYSAVPQDAIDGEVSVVGWNLNPSAKATVTDHYYELFGDTYSKYTYAITVSRPLLAAILKGLFPAFVLMVSGLLSLIMTTDKAGERLGVTTSALVGTVLFHLTLTDSVPPVPYLTWADRFMIVNYVALGLTLVVTGALVWLQGEHREDLAARFDPLFRALIPSLWVTGQVINLIFLRRLNINPGWVLVPLLLQGAQIIYLIARYRSHTVAESMDHAA